MEFTCGQCEGTGIYVGNPCSLCGGDGKIDLLDLVAMEGLDVGTSKRLLGIVWNEQLTKLSDIEDKVNDVLDKCNDIMEKLNE